MIRVRVLITMLITIVHHPIVVVVNRVVVHLLNFHQLYLAIVMHQYLHHIVLEHHPMISTGRSSKVEAMQIGMKDADFHNPLEG